MPRLVHFEMNVKDVHKTISFYEDVFGWRFQKWNGPMDYWLIMTGDEDEPGIDGGLGYAEEGFPKIVNTIAEFYVHQDIERKSKEAEKTLVFLNHQLPTLKKNLEKTEIALNQHRLKYGSIDLELENKTLLAKLAELDKQMSTWELMRI